MLKRAETLRPVSKLKNKNLAKTIDHRMSGIIVEMPNFQLEVESFYIESKIKINKAIKKNYEIIEYCNDHYKANLKRYDFEIVQEINKIKNMLV